MTQMPGVCSRLPCLDGFRALSILAVLAAHMLPLGPGRLQLNFMASLMGMSVFFCLSGFLITRFLWLRPSVLPFLIRRVARIAPLIAFFTFLFCGVLYQRWDSVVSANLYIINYDLTAMFPGITPLWSIAVEMQFYLCIAVAVALLGRKGFWMVGVVALIVTAQRISLGVVSNITTHLRVDEIMSGALLALVWLNPDHPRARWLVRLMPVFFWPAFLLWLLSCHPDLPWFAYFRPYFTALMIGGVLFTSGQWQHRLLDLPILRYVATISFALYVWHSAFLFGWFETPSDWERYLVMRPIALVLTFAIAHASTFWFELPINRWAHRLTLEEGVADRVVGTPVALK